MNNINPDMPFLSISDAAELAKMHPQTLRQYDRMGLVKPSRTSGKTRRYSLRNVAQLVEVARLSAEGVSLNAIKRILDLENEVVGLRAENRELQKIVDRLMISQPGSRVFAVSDVETVMLPTGKRPRRSKAVEIWKGQ